MSRATESAGALLEAVDASIVRPESPAEVPTLDSATTAQLLVELEARVEVGGGDALTLSVVQALRRLIAGNPV